MDPVSAYGGVRPTWLRRQQAVSKLGEASGFVLVFFFCKEKELSGAKITRDCLGSESMGTIQSVLHGPTYRLGTHQSLGRVKKHIDLSKTLYFEPPP